MRVQGSFNTLLKQPQHVDCLKKEKGDLQGYTLGLHGDYGLLPYGLFKNESVKASKLRLDPKPRSHCPKPNARKSSGALPHNRTSLKREPHSLQTLYTVLGPWISYLFSDIPCEHVVQNPAKEGHLGPLNRLP